MRILIELSFEGVPPEYMYEVAAYRIEGQLPLVASTFRYACQSEHNTCTELLLN